MPCSITRNKLHDKLQGAILTKSSTRVCILPPHLGFGGPASFQSGLIRTFQARGVEVTHDPTDPNLTAILIFGAVRSLQPVLRAQKTGVRVVQRLNGMNWIQRKKFTGVRHFVKAEVGNLKLRHVRRMADRIIYQSRFAREWWERENGVLTKPQAIIHNGVDLELFSPPPAARPKDRYRILMVEARHGNGYEQGLFTAVKLVKDLNGTLDKPCQLTIAGEVPDRLREKLDNSCITWLGVIPHTEITAIDRSAHLFFSGDVNATCPNAVLEALACGLPVLAYDTGAMRELVPPGAGRIVPYGGDVWALEKPDDAALVVAARSLLADLDESSLAARQHAERNYDIKAAADRYLEVLLND